MITRAIFAVLAILAASATPASAQFESWAAIVVAGDYRAHSGAPSEVFDNGRKDLVQALARLGFNESNILQFTSKPGGDPEMRAQPAATETIYSAFTRLAHQTSGGCFLYFTSHGAPQGILVGNQMMTPRAFSQLVNDACADRTTVAIISACYSGVFIPALRSDTRMIFTAARPDRSSFGCGEANQYTFFDQCVIESLPGSQNFPALAFKTQDCVAAREKEEMATPPSEPQLYVGSSVEGALRAYAFTPN